MPAHTDHSRANALPPATTGRTITWAWGYDTVTWLLTLGQEGRLRKATLALAGLRAGETVLDVGCGTGTLTRLAARQVGETGQVFGIDAAPEMVAVAQRKAAAAGSLVNYKVSLIEALEFPDHSFNVVLSSLMFHHLPGDLKRQGLAEIYRVLKPAGRLLIVDIDQSANPARRPSLVLMLHGGSGRRMEELAPLVREIGFAPIETGDVRFGPLGFVRAQRPA